MMHRRKIKRGYRSTPVVKTDLSGDFKIVMAAMTSVEDFKSLEEQFGVQFMPGPKY